jgi:hypothetical protein
MSNTYKLSKGVSFSYNNSDHGVVASTGITPSMTEYSDKLRELRENKMLGISSIDSYYALTAYAAIYTKVSNKLKSIIKSVDSMRNFYLVDVILSQISEDALAPRIGDDQILRYSVKDKKIQKELDDLQKRIGLDQLIENITPDILAYGEYTLATKIGNPEEFEDELNKGKKKKVIKSKPGILDVTDVVDQGTVISITQDGKTEGYLVINEVTGKVELRETADFVKFQLGGQRVRVDVKKDIPMGAMLNSSIREAVEKIPRFIRVGKSVLYPILGKLKELELMEKLVPATKINQLSQGNLVGMSLPDSFDLETALKAVKRLEGMINKKVNVDPTTKEITVESILSTAGKTKILPTFGEKGSLQNIDYRSDQPDSLTSDAKDIRELILDSVGVPSELVFKSDSDSKADILKRHSKYVRKLKRVQKTIAAGAKQIAFVHLSNKDIKFKKEDISVVFNNSLVEIDNLDKLEHADVTVSLLGNVKEFFSEMAEEDSPFKDSVDLNKVAEYIEDNLKTVGLADAIITQKEGGEDANAGGPLPDTNPVTAEPPEADSEEDDGEELEKEDNKDDKE